jgi:hypothetical protein
MNRYNCIVILPNDVKEMKILADTVHPDTTCATRFHKKIKVIGGYGTPEIDFELVAQYPTDRLIIKSVDQNIENELL